MQFKGYKIETIPGIFAMTFLLMAIVYENFAFIGSTIICLIFGIKKTKLDTTTNSDEDNKL